MAAEATPSRTELTDALKGLLKERVVPELRRRGFRGSFPHLRRVRETHHDLLSFDFGTWHSAFLYVEVGAVPLEGRVFGTEVVPVARVTAKHAESWRLGSAPNRDHWFEYGRLDEERDTWFALDPASTRKVVDSILSLLVAQAEPWWNGSTASPKGTTLPQVLAWTTQANELNRRRAGGAVQPG